MRVVITGGLGFIGSFLAEAYRDQGHSVAVIDNLSANVVEQIDGVHNMRGFDADLALEVAPADLIVHCASPVGAVGILSKSGHISSEISRTTSAVCEAAKKWRSPLVNISTSEVYGFSGVYSETDDIRVPFKHSARIEYAVGKLAAEYTVKLRDIPSLTIRPFNVAGPRQTSSKGFVVPTFVEQALEGTPLTVFYPGTQERSFTAVSDIVRFVVGLHPDQIDGQIVNVGNPANRTTILDLARLVIETTGSSSGLVETTGQAVHGSQYEEAEGTVKVPDISLARSLGWEPRVGLSDLIKETAAEYAALV